MQWRYNAPPHRAHEVLSWFELCFIQRLVELWLHSHVASLVFHLDSTHSPHACSLSSLSLIIQKKSDALAHDYKGQYNGDACKRSVSIDATTAVTHASAAYRRKRSYIYTYIYIYIKRERDHQSTQIQKLDNKNTIITYSQLKTKIRTKKTWPYMLSTHTARDGTIGHDLGFVM